MSRPVVERLPVDEHWIEALLSSVRPADRLEFESIRGLSVEQEVRDSIAGSLDPRALVVDGELLVLFGDIRFSEQVGVPWMISTSAVERHRRAFLDECDRQIAAMRLRHLVLINYTDARYAAALRWMRWLGFHMHEAVPYGANGELFHPFTLRGIPWEQQRQQAQQPAAAC